MTTPDDNNKGLVAALDKVLQEEFSKHETDIGTQFLGDWVLAAEVMTEEGAVLRLVSHDDTPLWRQQGLLKFAADDLTNDVLLYRMMGHEEE